MRNIFSTIANRIFLILIAGILLAMGVTTWLASTRHDDSLRELRFQHLIDRIEQVVVALDDVTPEARAAILTAAKNFGFTAQIVTSMPDVVSTSRNEMLAAMLKKRLGDDRQFAIQRETDCIPLHPNHPKVSGNRMDSCRVTYVSLQDHAILRLQLYFPKPPDQFRPPDNDMLPPGGPYALLFLALIGLLAYLVAKMAARPIGQLAQAASQLGQDIDHPPLKETGPREIRQAAKAFNAMQALIRRQIQHRTHMLAAITHDLQTPLTRMRLRLEKVQDPELQAKLIGDLLVMQGMVREGLDLARSMDSAEKKQRLDFDSLLDSLCADAIDAGQKITLTGQTHTFIHAQPGALRRCITNLLDNAIKYGQTATVIASLQRQQIVIDIHDEGPGIAEDELEHVFDPFYRLETSRSRDTGGTGLGLTIARNIAEKHGGSLILVNRPGGGLTARLTLPASPAAGKHQ
jgi:signal transduction histidine kinase